MEFAGDLMPDAGGASGLSIGVDKPSKQRRGEDAAAAKSLAASAADESVIGITGQKILPPSPSTDGFQTGLPAGKPAVRCSTVCGRIGE